MTKTKNSYYTKHREPWVEGAAAKEAAFQHRLRLEDLGAGFGELYLTSYHHLKAESGVQQVSSGLNGRGEHFEVWSKE